MNGLRIYALLSIDIPPTVMYTDLRIIRKYTGRRIGIKEGAGMKGYNTGQRRLLAEFLERHMDQPLSAEQIAEMISAEGGEISLSAVYRNIERMEKDGLVRRSSSGEGRRAVYQYIGGACAKHLHMQCTNCGDIIHLDDNATNAMRMAVRSCGDFSIDERRTVLYGCCGNCSHNGGEKEGY